MSFTPLAVVLCFLLGFARSVTSPIDCQDSAAVATSGPCLT